jgi:hypothetical protein
MCAHHPFPAASSAAVTGRPCPGKLGANTARITASNVQRWRFIASDDIAFTIGEEKAKCGTLLGVKWCRVSFKDSEDIEHAVEVEARSLYEAVGLAIGRFRRCEHVKYEPQGLHEFVVDSRDPGTQHRLTRRTFDNWLGRPGGSPADVALKSRLKSLLG